jgi:hypothetical protein
MNKLRILLYFLVCVLIFGCHSHKGLGKATSLMYLNASSQINVKDFGAIGNGESDDTEAILQAIEYAHKQEISTYLFDKSRLKSSIFMGSIPTVYFPAGVYKITKTIPLGSYVSIKSDKAILIPSEIMIDNELAAMKGIGWQCDISGLQFIKFQTAIDLDNNNIDCGKINIEDCDFLDNKIAIKIKCQSTLTTIEKNRFINNGKVLIVEKGDKVVLAKNWISGLIFTKNIDAAIENKGVLHFNENSLGPYGGHENKYRECAWINNHRTIFALGNRQGGEMGSVTLVNNFAKADMKYPPEPNAVTIHNSDSYAVSDNIGSNITPGAIRLFEIPNQIVCEHIRGLTASCLINYGENREESIVNFLKDNFKSSLVKIYINDILGGQPLDNDLIIPTAIYETAKQDNIDKKEISSIKTTKSNILLQNRNMYENEFVLDDISSNYLISFTGNPSVSSSGVYSGGMVISLRVNGTYLNGKVGHEISYSVLFNDIGAKNIGVQLFKPQFMWKSTKTSFKESGNEDNTILVKINQSTGYEKLNIINLNKLK